MFVPQQRQDDPVRNYVGDGTHRVEVRSTERAEFFVFNAGDEPDGMGFRLCRLCSRSVEVESVGRGGNGSSGPGPQHPIRETVPGQPPSRVHLGHEFISSAARLAFAGTGRPYTDQAFWQSLMYAVLGGMVLC